MYEDSDAIADVQEQKERLKMLVDQSKFREAQRVLESLMRDTALPTEHRRGKNVLFKS